jgi:hypothetical protein
MCRISLGKYPIDKGAIYGIRKNADASSQDKSPSEPNSGGRPFQSGGQGGKESGASQGNCQAASGKGESGGGQGAFHALKLLL